MDVYVSSHTRALLTMHIQRRILRQTYDTVENYYLSKYLLHETHVNLYIV